VIENMQSLSACNIISICNYLADGGEATISNNATGCNSVEEVETSCLVAVNEPGVESGISVYPNPTTGWLSVTSRYHHIQFLQLLDANGKPLRQWNTPENYIQINSLDAGVYILMIHTEAGLFPARIIKVD
jgi:hypothetical protein